MDVVGHAAGGDEAGGMVSQDAADVFEEAWLEVGRDFGLAVFRAEDDVAMQRR